MLPTLREVIESSLGLQLPPLPAPPRTVKNLDKACAALLDFAPGSPARNTAAGLAQSAKLGAVFVEAMRHQLSDSTHEKMAAAVEGLVTDYLEKRNRRSRVLEIAAREITQAPPTLDANSLIDDDWMAFFKGKVDHLGTEEAKLLFGKVLAGEIKQPGSFSKRSIGMGNTIVEAFSPAIS